ncbi:MAG: hypothetical protein ABSH34_29490 [Verrucomicrobiota bacterium]
MAALRRCFGSVGLSGDAVDWVDLPEGIQAFRRSNGEYPVLMKEDWKSKILMCQWKSLIESGFAAGPWREHT